MIVYLNGRFLPLAEASISPQDRGFLFADGLYEGVAAYAGEPFLWDEHMERLAIGLRALEIPYDELPALRLAAQRLLADNDLRDRDAFIYLQVTRGPAPRAHPFPRPPIEPTVYVEVKPLSRVPEEQARQGVATITVPDLRWARCDLKTLSLTANVLAKEAAVRADAYEALLVRDGAALEGSHSNFFAVLGGGLVTFPESPFILPGVTRRLVLELAAELSLPTRLAAVRVEDLPRLEEAFLTGTTTEVLPVVTIDGRPVRSGRPGDVTLRLRQAFLEHTTPVPAREA
ncbi:MAG: aminotransferase class IV [Thermoanaerobaculia bacterium]